MQVIDHICFSEDDFEVDGILSDITDVPSPWSVLANSFRDNGLPKHDASPFEAKKRDSWNKEQIAARCDLNFLLKISPRAGVNFISIYKKTLYGRLLTDIKDDDKMVSHFAKEVSTTIRTVLGENLHSGGWCIITAPRRRHLERNFATLVCLQMASVLAIPFYEDALSCHSRHRMNAVFEVNRVPSENNIIVFDDIVTTGSTLASINKALKPYGKNLVFFAGINNKL